MRVCVVIVFLVVRRPRRRRASRALARDRARRRLVQPVAPKPVSKQKQPGSQAAGRSVGPGGAPGRWASVAPVAVGGCRRARHPRRTQWKRVGGMKPRARSRRRARRAPHSRWRLAGWGLTIFIEHGAQVNELGPRFAIPVGRPELCRLKQFCLAPGHVRPGPGWGRPRAAGARPAGAQLRQDTSAAT